MVKLQKQMNEVVGYKQRLEAEAAQPKPKAPTAAKKVAKREMPVGRAKTETVTANCGECKADTSCTRHGPVRYRLSPAINMHMMEYKCTACGTEWSKIAEVVPKYEGHVVFSPFSEPFTGYTNPCVDGVSTPA